MKTCDATRLRKVCENEENYLLRNTFENIKAHLLMIRCCVKIAVPSIQYMLIVVEAFQKEKLQENIYQYLPQNFLVNERAAD